MLIRQSAETLISLKQQQVDIEKELKELSKTRPVIHQLAYNPETKTGLKGIGIITASAMTAEIIHINRFFSNNSLALYCGLGMIEDETGKKRPGERKRMIRFPSYNRRLKYAFITAAKNFVRFNPDHHLSGMYRNLLKKGMTQLEARKRVARALVRMIFRILKNYEAEKIKQEDKGRQIG
jgi:transposase